MTRPNILIEKKLDPMGRIVIPRLVLDDMQVKPGDKVTIHYKDGLLIVWPNNQGGERSENR